MMWLIPRRKDKLIYSSTLLIILGLLLGGLGVVKSSCAAEPIERIAAIVGSEPILSSELAAQIQLMAIQRGIRPRDDAELKELQEQVLNELITERLLLYEAKKDTSIAISNERIEQAVDDHINNLITQFPSDDAFINELAREGLSLRAFKKKLRPEIKNQLYKQALINNKLAGISISNQQVTSFFEEYRDSIPDQPEAVRLSHILITFQASGGTETTIHKKAEIVRNNAVSGADFATLAMTYSDGPTSLSGGDLGFVSRDDVVPEFGRAAFSLHPGAISGIIRTVYGLHIIKCEDIRGDKAHLRHILFEIVPTQADSMLSYGLIDSLLTELENDADFPELAKIFSADDDSRKQGGELGWFAVANLPPEFSEGVKNLKEINDIIGPVHSEYGLHILKLLDRQKERPITLEEDFDKIKEMARQSKTGELVEKWIEEIREKVYVDIRLF